MSDAKETQTSEGAERIDPPGVISSEEPEAIQGFDMKAPQMIHSTTYHDQIQAKHQYSQ